MLGFHINPWIGWCWCFFTPIFCSVSLCIFFLYIVFYICLFGLATWLIQVVILLQNSRFFPMWFVQTGFLPMMVSLRYDLFLITCLFLVHLYLQLRDVYATFLWRIRVSRMGHGGWLAVDSIVSIIHSCCDDIQVDGYQWNYQRGKHNWTN